MGFSGPHILGRNTRGSHTDQAPIRCRPGLMSWSMLEMRPMTKRAGLKHPGGPAGHRHTGRSEGWLNAPLTFSITAGNVSFAIWQPRPRTATCP